MGWVTYQCVPRQTDDVDYLIDDPLYHSDGFSFFEVHCFRLVNVFVDWDSENIREKN